MTAPLSDPIEEAARTAWAEAQDRQYSEAHRRITFNSILKRLYDAGKKAGAEELRETNTSLNRRATRAEAIVAQRVEEQERKGHSLGRSLANAGYHLLKAENQRLREALEKIAGVEKGMGTHRPCCARGAELARAALESKVRR